MCVVTGAAAGIGRAVAGRLAQEGGRVALADIDLAGAERAAAEIPGAAAFPVDVTDPAAVEALYAAVRERFGSIDVCHNNAGILLADDTDPPATELDVWHRILAVDLTGRLPLHEVPAAAHARDGRRLDRQHELDGGPDRLGDAADRVRGGQGRRPRHDPRGRDHLRPERHPLQRALPGAGRHAALPKRARRRRGRARAADGAHPDGPARAPSTTSPAPSSTWRATTRRGRRARPWSSTAGSPRPTRRPHEGRRRHRRRGPLRLVAGGRAGPRGDERRDPRPREAGGGRHGPLVRHGAGPLLQRGDGPAREAGHRAPGGRSALRVRPHRLHAAGRRARPGGVRGERRAGAVTWGRLAPARARGGRARSSPRFAPTGSRPPPTSPTVAWSTRAA